jgi:hypothetical protein
MELHVWALELVNVRFETTCEVQQNVIVDMCEHVLFSV